MSVHLLHEYLLGTQCAPETVLSGGVSVQNSTDDIAGLMKLVFY